MSQAQVFEIDGRKFGRLIDINPGAHGCHGCALYDEGKREALALCLHPEAKCSKFLGGFYEIAEDTE